jgi:hypothetical protein
MSKKKVLTSMFLFCLFFGFLTLMTHGDVRDNVSQVMDKDAPLDLIFVIDTTGSMWDDIINVKLRSTEIVNTIDATVKDYRIAVVDYRDFPVSPYGGYYDYPYNANLPFSRDKNAIINALQGLTLGWGADWQESVLTALVNSINTIDLTDWRCDARKVIILMGDAPPHDPEPISGYTAQSVADAAQAVVNGCPVDSPAIVYTISIGNYSATTEAFGNISESTGGSVFIAENAGEVVDTIIEVIDEIEEIPPAPEPEETNSAPDCSNAIASISELWPPNHKMHAIEVLNVTDPDGDPVFITITGITQDEPVDGPGNSAKGPDAEGVGTDIAWIKAERDGRENSRVYKISFTATDDKGAECSGSVNVCVRHDKGLNTFCIDDGQKYDSTVVPTKKGGKK